MTLVMSETHNTLHKVKRLDEIFKLLSHEASGQAMDQMMIMLERS